MGGDRETGGDTHALGGLEQPIQRSWRGFWGSDQRVCLECQQTGLVLQPCNLAIRGPGRSSREASLCTSQPEGLGKESLSGAGRLAAFGTKTEKGHRSQAGPNQKLHLAMYF